MRRTQSNRIPDSRRQLSFEPLEPRELLAADTGADWFSSWDAPTTDDWTWTFDDSWNSAPGSDASGTDGWWTDGWSTDAWWTGDVSWDPSATEGTDAGGDAGWNPDAGTTIDAATPVDPSVLDVTPPAAPSMPVEDGVVPKPEDATVVPVTDAQCTPESDTVEIAEPSVDDGSLQAAAAGDEDSPDPSQPPVVVVCYGVTDGVPTMWERTQSDVPSTDGTTDPNMSDSIGDAAVVDGPSATDDGVAEPQANEAAEPSFAADSSSTRGDVGFAAPPAANGAGRNIFGAWGAFLGTFGPQANDGAQSAGQPGTGRPRIRLPFRPIV